ncbi:MAG TPA: hypothetical protein VFY71_11815 [Planctomycetota bacterium]|nr:hypothetical protein [Planctomycetota bacterium]
MATTGPWALAAVLAMTCVLMPARAGQVSGIVQSGGTSVTVPLADVDLTLLEATTGQPIVLSQATSGASGEFVLSSPRDTSSSIFFITADVASGVRLVTILGPRLRPDVTVNELTTVAASYSMAQFYRTGVISGNAFGLRIAAGMCDNIVSSATGESSPVLLGSPNADQTNSLRSTRSLANLLAGCLQDPLVLAGLLDLTTPPGGAAPQHTAQALANLARDPGLNVTPIYLLTQLSDLYQPALFEMPDAWTVTVKVNDSGDDAILFGGPANIVFDDHGYAWVANNVVQGTTQSAHSIMVLKPNGQPADGTNGSPVSPITGGGLLGVGLGIDIDKQGAVWVGNFGWGGDNPTATGNGSVSQFRPSGAPVSGRQAYQGGPVRVQGTIADADGNIWLASYGNDSVFVFLGGDPDAAVSVQQYPGSQTFDIAIAPDGTAWATNGGGLAGGHPSSVARFALVGGVLQQLSLDFVGKALKTVAVDSLGNAWVASQGDDTIYVYRPDGQLIGGFGGGGIDGPWGVTVDGDDNIWVSNFGPLELGSNFTTGRLTKLCGANPAMRPPGTRMGDPLSPPTGYTVHSAGRQVLLHDGEPLYGPAGPPSFAPMMRQTNVDIDQAGNLWAVNNWKPDFDVDILLNPGGDGIVIFVGLATPPARRR